MSEPLITNPNAVAMHVSRGEDGDEAPKKPVFLVNKLASLPDFDATIDNLTTHIATRVVEVDAKIFEGSGRNRRLHHYKNFREFAASPSVRKRLREGISLHKLKEIKERVQTKSFQKDVLREATEFEQGLYADEVRSTGTMFPLQDTFLPSLNSPYAKQQTFHDFMTAHARCWEAATRNPLGKRIVRLVPQFVLSRGLTCDIPEPAHQAAWNEFWKRHTMQLRLKVWLRELMTYGEQFNRHFVVKGKLTQRQIDPCTIWDVVTNPEDLEDVWYYYQQYIATSPIIVPGERGPASTLIIRHIPAEEVDHFTINKTSSEKRGRSELYAVIGWLLRFKEFMNDRIMQNKMRSMFALDVSVKGGAVEVAAANAQFSTPPGPGAVAVHNDAVSIDYKNASTDASDAETDASMILKIIAIGAGVSEQFLGVSSAQTRASALLQTEPDVKNFEDYQDVMEVMLSKTYERLVKAEGLSATKKVFEVSFPGLAAEDRSAKLKDLAMMEAQDWITKERSATIAARELGVSGYDFTAETAAIKAERGQDPVVMQGFQSVTKVAPDPLVASAPGAGAVNAKNDDSRKVVSTAGQMGASAQRLSGRNLANTSTILDRGTFTRGGERASIKGKKSAGAPLRASAGGWSATAREASLRTRRETKLRRLREEARGVDPTTPHGQRVLIRMGELQMLLGQHAETDPTSPAGE